LPKLPRHIRNIAIAILLVILALAGAINSYIHYQFKSNIDHALTSIQAIAHIKYREISTSPFSAEVKLENVQISSPFLPDEITLGDLTFETPGFLYLLAGPKNISKGELPEHFGFSIKDFYFDLHSETADLLNNLVKRLQPLYAAERTICAGKSIFGPADYKEMGYSRLLSNLRIAYDFNKQNGTLHLSLAANTQNMADIKGDINFSNVRNITATKFVQGNMPKLTSAEISYNDKTYTPRVIKYCADLSEMKKEEYIDAEVTQSDNYFYMLWGFAPGKGLREAYKDFLSKPDVVTLTINPGKNFDANTASTLPLQELISSLNVRLKINGLLVKNLSYTKATDEFTENFKQQFAAKLDLNSLLRGEQVKVPEPAKEPVASANSLAAYHPIEVADLAKHIGSFVQITTDNGNERNGKLIRMDSFNFYVEQKVSGGKFTMTIPKEKIKTVKAYFAK
jgi:hypothetical protein